MVIMVIEKQKKVLNVSAGACSKQQKVNENMAFAFSDRTSNSQRARVLPEGTDFQFKI